MTTTWVYLRSEPQLFTVGFYDPTGTWHGDSDHDTREAAAARVHYLNGSGFTASTLPAAPAASGPPKYARNPFWVYRREHELTQQEVADMLGISRQLVSLIEKGRRRITPDKAILWSRPLGVTREFLCPRIFNAKR